MGTVSPRSVALTGTHASTTRRHRAGHVLLGASSWVALAALWVWQLDVYVPSDWLGGVELIFVLLVGWTCFSVLWVAWCRGIYRRRHRRTSSLSREVDFEHDPLGRRILAPQGIATAQGQVLISVREPGVKRYQLAETRAAERTASVRRDSPHVESRRRRQVA